MDPRPTRNFKRYLPSLSLFVVGCLLSLGNHSMLRAEFATPALGVGLVLTSLISFWVHRLIYYSQETSALAASRGRDLVSAAEHSQATQHARSQFLANMNHELRTPLNIVLGMADLLELTKLDDEQNKFVANLKRSGRHLLGLVEDLMDTVARDAAGLNVQFAPFSLADLLHEVAAHCTVPARAKKLDFSLFVDPRLPLQVVTDRKRLRQALLNLINNAIKFTDRGSVILRAYMSTNDGENVKVSFEVIDTGIGIGVADQARIFAEFVQVDPSNTRTRGGMGLGLTIVQAIAQRMNGEIRVSSNIGIGSHFTLNLSFKIHDARAWTDTLWTMRSAVTAKTIFLMMVDDESRESLRLSLTGLGFNVTLADTGADTLARFAEIDAGHDLLILDSVMKDMGAIAVLQKMELTERLRQKTCVILQPLHRKDDLAVLARMGLEHIVFRPVSVRSVLQTWEAKLTPTDTHTAA